MNPREYYRNSTTTALMLHLHQIGTSNAVHTSEDRPEYLTTSFAVYLKHLILHLHKDDLGMGQKKLGIPAQLCDSNCSVVRPGLWHLKGLIGSLRGQRRLGTQLSLGKQILVLGLLRRSVGALDRRCI